MTTIRLEALDFFAHHGFYEEERKIGNRYTVDVEVYLPVLQFTDDQLEQTVNYEEIYITVAEVMSTSTKLLETLASRINASLLNQFPGITGVKTTVSKHNPPIKGICDRASVTIDQQRDAVK